MTISFFWKLFYLYSEKVIQTQLIRVLFLSQAARIKQRWRFSMSQLPEFLAGITHSIEYRNSNNVITFCGRLCLEPMPGKFWPPNIYTGFVLPLPTKSLWLIMYCLAQYRWCTKYFLFFLYVEECLRKVSQYQAVCRMDRFDAIWKWNYVEQLSRGDWVFGFCK